MEDFARKIDALARPDAPIVAAVSGGVDSMVLLDLLATRPGTIVAHFNHQLRDTESDADENFVRETAARLNLPFRRASADVRAAAKGISIEMAARQLRHAFLAKVAREFHAPVALAHHADDQIELFIMRLLRGIEGPGLGGMRAISPSPADPNVLLLRPLLEFRRAEILSYARSRKLQWREDSSNRELHAERNRIRNIILPALRAESPRDLDQSLLAHIHAQQQQAEALRAAAKSWLTGTTATFHELPAALRRGIIVQQLHDHQIAPTGSLIDELSTRAAASIDSQTQATLKPNGKLQIRRAQPPPTEIQIDLSRDGEVLFSGYRISWRILNSFVPNELVFDADLIGPTAILRPPRPGDRIQLSGRASERPLAEMFSRNKIPRADRDRAIVATTAHGRLFWAAGLRITEQFKTRPQTRRFLEWTWRRA